MIELKRISKAPALLIGCVLGWMVLAGAPVHAQGMRDWVHGGDVARAVASEVATSAASRPMRATSWG